MDRLYLRIELEFHGRLRENGPFKLLEDPILSDAISMGLRFVEKPRSLAEIANEHNTPARHAKVGGEIDVIRSQREELRILRPKVDLSGRLDCSRFKFRRSATWAFSFGAHSPKTTSIRKPINGKSYPQTLPDADQKFEEDEFLPGILRELTGQVPQPSTAWHGCRQRRGQLRPPAR